MRNKTKVIAISGASGSGKSTLVCLLAKHFSCPSIHFDDFVEKNTYPVDMEAWFNDGADFNLFQTPKMLTTLQQRLTENHQYIFIDEPFGREREQMSHYIDEVVLLAPALELCLARLLARNLNKQKPNQIQRDHQHILAYLARYQAYLRDIYRYQVEKISLNCDFQVEAASAIEHAQQEILTWLSTRSNLPIKITVI
ncbi:hypothetical protein [Thalassotalea ganghwensis]